MDVLQNKMLRPLAGQTRLLEGETKKRMERDRAYLLRLKPENLLFSHYFEAGLKSYSHKPEGIHWGWDSPTSEIRGTFTGHWLSAAARIYAQTNDPVIRQRADDVVSEIGRCQEENGGRWAFPIPEKYLYWLKRKKNIWAPQYVCHKNMMGLLDMYRFAGNDQALEIVEKCADWFYEYTQDISRELMDEMMEMQESGGMMMFWADLYAVTENPRHLELMHRYERPLLYEPLLRGEDVLTNMHVNMTVPEILGAARAYEVTGEERFRRIVENYWTLAVDQRGYFATGGQSSGEVWTPPGTFSPRLGSMTQEHCVVYHMMQLAEFLFRWTGDKKYGDYYERNLLNGIFAQGFWESHPVFQKNEGTRPETGLITYYLPLGAGSKKQWGSETEDFWCCHGSLVQANAMLNQGIYYQDENTLLISQFIPSETWCMIGDQKVGLSQVMGNEAGDILRLGTEAYTRYTRPTQAETVLTIHMESRTWAEFVLSVRIPEWVCARPEITVNGQPVRWCEDGHGFARIHRKWQDQDVVRICLPKCLFYVPLPDRPDTVAFMDGSVVLAGLCSHEHMLYGDINHPETILTVDDERHWGTWNNNFRTINQPVGLKFKPLYDIGNETYTVYFQVREENYTPSAS